jgi:FkbM family methyltransferase
MRIWRTQLRPRLKSFAYRYRSNLLYRIASFYVNAVDNDHDSAFATNGEQLFANTRLRGAKIVFDVGAAQGRWTKIALESDPNVVVHCFEPTSRRFQILIDRKFGERVKLNNFALGDSPGTSKIFYGASGGSNSLYPQRYDGESYAPTDVEMIQISTIDDYCRDHRIEHVDFIKMDIEGHETAAVRGAAAMLRAGKIDIIQFEYSYVFLDADASLLKLMQYVRSLNPDYDFYKLYPDGPRRVDAYRHTMDNFKTQNWAIIRRAARQIDVNEFRDAAV